MEGADGCDAEFLDVDATQDEDLPVAVGGVQFVNEGIGSDGRGDRFSRGQGRRETRGT